MMAIFYRQYPNAVCLLLSVAEKQEWDDVIKRHIVFLALEKHLVGL